MRSIANRSTWVLAFLLGCATACGGSSAVEERVAHPEVRTPRSARQLPLPQGAAVAAVWVSHDGGGVAALRDGRLLAIDPTGVVTPIDRLPGDTLRPGDAPVLQFGARGTTGAIALVPDGALLVERGIVRRATLPQFLGTPRAFTPLGPEALWATPEGLYASAGGQWFGLELPGGPVRNASELAVVDGAKGGREAWVHAGPSLYRVRIDGGSPPRVTWIEAMPGVEVGPVRAIARVAPSEVAVAAERGVAVVSPRRIRVVRGAPEDGVPQALGGGGGWAWVGWAGRIVRTDGEHVESLAGNVALGPNARIAVDDDTGATALVVDEHGDLFRIEAEETLRLSGLTNGATVADTRLELEAIAPRSEALKSVAFSVDGKLLVTRTAAPWGWGQDGGRSLDLKDLPFAAHGVDVVAHYRDGRDLRRGVTFDYVSPLGRVPSYAADIAPLVAARCARCHATGVAHDLKTYDALTLEADAVRAAVREGRMPPDLQLDGTSRALITAWIDGDTPP